jgi:hypothetical protein
MTDEEIQALQNELAAVYQHNAALQEEIEMILALGDVKQPRSAQSTQMMANATFTLDGKTYGFNFGAAVYKGQKITPLEIAADENLQRELISKSAGIIKELD